VKISPSPINIFIIKICNNTNGERATPLTVHNDPNPNELSLLAEIKKFKGYPSTLHENKYSFFHVLNSTLCKYNLA
jgi:hypothetical protein